MNDLGPAATRSFVDQLQRVVNQWLLHRGFSVGVEDAVISDDAQAVVTTAIAKATDEVNRVLKRAQSGTIPHQAGRSMRECVEGLANTILNGARDEVWR